MLPICYLAKAQKPPGWLGQRHGVGFAILRALATKNPDPVRQVNFGPSCFGDFASALDGQQEKFQREPDLIGHLCVVQSTPEGTVSWKAPW